MSVNLLSYSLQKYILHQKYFVLNKSPPLIVVHNLAEEQTIFCFPFSLTLHSMQSCPFNFGILPGLQTHKLVVQQLPLRQSIPALVSCSLTGGTTGCNLMLSGETLLNTTQCNFFFFFALVSPSLSINTNWEEHMLSTLDLCSANRTQFNACCTDTA